MKRSTLILRVSAITTSGFLITFPLFLWSLWVCDQIDCSTSANYSGRGGAAPILLLGLPSIFILRWLRKKPKYSKLLVATTDEVRPFVYGGLILAGLAFLVFLTNLKWFDLHNMVRDMLGVVIMWLLIFSVTADSFANQPKKK